MKHMNLKRIMLLLFLMSCFLNLGYAETIPDPDTSAVNAFLASQAGSQKDAWLVATLQSGAEGVAVSEHVYSFTLCAYDPDIKGLGSYAKADDKAAWRQKMLANVSGHNLQVSVAIQDDGSVAQKDAQRFLNAVKQAVRTAKNAFTGKDMNSALSDLLFCAPTAERKPSAASLLSPDASFSAWTEQNPVLGEHPDQKQWAALFHVQRNMKYSIKNGPHELALTWDGADPEQLLRQAYHAASADLTAKSRNERTPEDALPEFFDEKLAETAIKMKQGRLVRQKATVDLMRLGQGEYPSAYISYLDDYTYSEMLEKLCEDYALLPEEASQPFPKTGKLTVAPKKGRTVSVSIPEDGVSAYVQLRDADTGVIISDAFIAAGKNVNMKATEGIYFVQYATGTAWYGQEALFGPTGSYAASDEFILGKKKLTLSVMQNQAGIVLHPVEATAFAATDDVSVHVTGKLAADVPLGTYPDTHPAVPGVSSITGLPSSGEPYTPVVIVLDNAEEAYPHWGVSDADIVFQVPNAGSGATKLLALFADHYPEQAGPVRSGRASMLPAAMSFNAAFAFAGPPAVKDTNIDIEALMASWKMSSTHRVYNLLHGNEFKERFPGLIRSHDLSCHVRMIHDNLVNKGVVFEERPFLFADEPRTEGQEANIVKVLHHGESLDTASNSASRAVFVYDPQSGAYSRRNSSGFYLDRLTEENVQFANVIVLRTKLSYEHNYVFLKNHLVGSGAAEIFQNGRYIHGAWVRSAVNARLVFVDDHGKELTFQRGRTFIVMTNEITEVIFSE